MLVTIHANPFFLCSCLSLFLLAASPASAQDNGMRTVDHKDYQLQVPSHWESFDSETSDGGLVQIFYDPDLKATSRQCMLESSIHQLSSEELDSQPMKSAWRQRKWMEVLPHIAEASDVTMKESSYTRNGKGQGQHIGEFTFYASQFFWHSRSYVLHSNDRLINLTCSATSHASPVEAEKAFTQISPVVSQIANSITRAH